VTDLDPTDLAIMSTLNGNMMQSAKTSQMLFDVYTLVSFISQVMTLLPGDVIATGTPAGVGPMKPGDVVEILIEGIGRLQNRVV
jgi:2-keto-4-pentenoate hydratase/2-oxohepta-3-ene-1,7-dioic acid hydratase in catechol pathway